MQIAVDSIDIISGARVVDPADQDMLTLNIKAVGLLHPISVCANQAVAGRYNMISGRNRLSAVKTLEWPLIDAIVKTYSEAQAMMAELGENLCRSDYTVIERADAVKRYADLVAATYPGLKEHLQSHARQDANLREGKKKKAAADADLAAQPSPVDVVAGKLGTTPRRVYEQIQLAGQFTDEEKVVLRDRKLSAQRLNAMAKLPSEDKVAAINLIASGMSYAQAMTDVLGDAYTDDGEDDDPISDEDFLASCPARKHASKIRFDADALLYRRIQKQRVAFSKRIGWAATKGKVAEMGVYTRRLMLFLEAKHPRDWLHCPNCVHGQAKGGSVCQYCKGGGYQLG